LVLNNLAHQYEGQVAVISVYSSNGSPPFYNASGYQKIHNYPPPYWISGNWHFATPWLWVDGNKEAAYLTNTWNTHITQRLQAPAYLDIQISGNFVSATNTLYLQFLLVNTGSTTINGLFHGVLTENGVQWNAPNGQQVHSHIPRIWWPDATGNNVSVSPGGQVTLNTTWNIDNAWDQDSLWVVAFVQDGVMQPDSTYEMYQGASVKMVDILTAISANNTEIIDNFQLFRNYPNPFNPATHISYFLPQPAKVELKIYNTYGQEITALMNQQETPGNKTVTWDGRDRAGIRQASGVYFYQLRADGKTIDTKKMFLLK
jgi:hypothetical protein